MSEKLVETIFLIKEENEKKLEYLQSLDVEILDIMIERLYEKFRGEK